MSSRIDISQISRSFLLLLGCAQPRLVALARRTHLRSRAEANLPAMNSRDSGAPGRQLAHESREAAGEEKDEMDEFKQSASVRLISPSDGT